MEILFHKKLENKYSFDKEVLDGILEIFKEVTKDMVLKKGVKNLKNPHLIISLLEQKCQAKKLKICLIEIE